MSNEVRVKGLIDKVKEDQAFPSSLAADTLGFIQGLSKREYFAAVVLQGITASCPWYDDVSASMFAMNAVNIADALIAELAKNK